MYRIHLRKTSLLLWPTSRKFEVAKLILGTQNSTFSSESMSLWHKHLIIRYRILVYIFLISTIQTVPFNSTYACLQVFRYSQWVVLNSSLMGCDATSLGDCHVKFWRNALTSCSSGEFFMSNLWFKMKPICCFMLLQNVGNHSTTDKD
jgi:hypothetical protein